ncbi:VOC family protein [Actinotalea ferrariae]|uniref:VOC family protein n=1 Tax=Actinotalea ferrariae TaxID=1386098 RepID=UPI001C8B8C4F|nr:VOC family protein [Actinotalea ferrariae]MBX9244722.1 VOC family protein [Actinotalea ferrariae]
MTAFRGIATVNLWADDVPAAAAWYTEVLEVEPYFVRPEAPAPPAYVEFRVGDRETDLGIVDRAWARSEADRQTPAAGGGVIAHWAVDDLEATYERLLALGAVPHDPPTVRGDGFVTASVVDPFGNVLGVMRNVHYAAMFADEG